MVLAELGSKLSKALAAINRTTVLDDAVVDEMLKEIGNALMSADVQLKLVIQMRQNIKKAISVEDMAGGLNKRKIIQKVIR